MRRMLRFGFGILVILIVLLAVNAFVLDKETRPPGVNAPDGQLTSDLDGESPVDLQYVDHPATGSGPEGEPIVLLHCYTCSLRWWDQMVPLLNENHRVITFDLLGHGGSEKPSSGYEIKGQSAAIAGALSDLDVSAATVVGHSMGGIVATSLAEQSSDLVDKVVLVDVPAESGDGDLPTTAKAATWPVLGEAIWRLKLDSMVKSAAERSFAPGTDVEDVFPDEPDRVVDDIDAMTFKSFKESEQASTDFLDDGSIPSRLTTTGVPVMAIMGDEDQILDADEVLGKYEAIPGARIVPIADAGHAPNVEQPEEVADQVLSFVGNAPIAPPPEPPQPGKGGNPDKGGKPDDKPGRKDEGGKKR